MRNVHANDPCGQGGQVSGYHMRVMETRTVWVVAEEIGPVCWEVCFLRVCMSGSIQVMCDSGRPS